MHKKKVIEEKEIEEVVAEDDDKNIILSPARIKALQIMTFFPDLDHLDLGEKFDYNNPDHLMIYAYEVGKRRLWGG